MLKIYKTIDNRITEIPELEVGSWVNVINPNMQEIKFLLEEMKLESDFVSAALDEEESSHIEREDDQLMILVDVPVAEKQDDASLLYSTMPIAMIITTDYVVSISLREDIVMNELASGVVKNVQTQLKTRFLFTVLLRVAARFLVCLKQIEKISSSTEKMLHKSMRNKELIQLLAIEKSLVYFSTSLKSNEITLEKILRGRVLTLYEEDEDLLQDVIIEVKQAIEMCGIYADILSGTMDAFASIISNNLNIVMKVLTSITIVMAIPTMVSSFYGMNVSGLPMPYFWFPLALSLGLTIIAGIILVCKGMFR
ncbi:MAG: magnesium transporter CorA family protein [Oscillospiraceae bacterium]